MIEKDHIGGTRLPPNKRMSSEITNRTRKTTNSTCAIWIDMISTPLNPSRPAIIASTRNTIIKSITGSSFFCEVIVSLRL